MDKLSIIVLLVTVVCSCHGISDVKSIKSTSNVPIESNPIVADVVSAKEPVVAQSTDMVTGRGKKGDNGGGNNHKNRMELIHMGLSYFKMVLSTLMAFIGHVFAFKSVGLSLISVLIQVAQFIMTLKRSKESQPTAYKVVETQWHTTPAETSYGGGYGGGAYGGGGGAYGGAYGVAQAKSSYGPVAPSAYAAPSVQPVRRRR